MLHIDFVIKPDLESDKFLLPHHVRADLETDLTRYVLASFYDDESGHEFIEAVTERDFRRTTALLPTVWKRHYFPPDQQFEIDKDDLIEYLTKITIEESHEAVWRMLSFCGLAQSSNAILTTLFTTPYHVPEDEEPEPIIDCYSYLDYDTTTHAELFENCTVTRKTKKRIIAR